MALPPGLPPTLPQHPLVQTLRWMREPFGLLEECGRRFGDIFVLRIATYADIVIVSDPEAVRELFAASGDEVHAGESNAVLTPFLGRSSVIVLDGAPHQRQRRLLMPAFQGERMNAYAGTMLALAQQGLATWPLGDRFPLHREMQRVTLQVILRTIFGIEEGPRFARFAELLGQGMDHASSPILLFPQVQKDLGRFSPWGRFLRFKEQADRVLYEEIARGRAAPPGRTDILSVLCSARDEDGAPMRDEEIRDELVTMLVAGHETTATGLSWAFRWLLDPARQAEDPTLIGRLRAELDGARQGGALAPERVARLELLDATAREALRLKPVVPLVGRVLKQPRRVLGYDLPAGTMVSPAIYLVHRRPSLYPEPARFRPERFLSFRPAPHEYFPFGGGLRRCIGAAFALLEMKMVMAAILDGAELEAAPGYRERVRRRGVTLVPSEGMPVILRRCLAPGATRAG